MAKSKQAKILDRDAILAADDLKREKVAVPEWGGAVYVRTMNGAERDDYDAEMEERGGRVDKQGVKGANANFRAFIVSLMAVDGEGVRLFSEADVEALGQKSGQALHRVFAAAMRINGLRNSDLKAITKN